MPGIDVAQWPLAWVLALLAAAALAIALLGSRLSRTADQLADKTGMGEAVFGAVLLGGATSISGIATSVTAATEGYPRLAFSNAVGGIAVQTAFLALADMAYRRANLEHAAASVENMIQGALLTALLAIPLLAMGSPDSTFLGIHPASLALFAAYFFGVRLARHAHASPLWQPRQTQETREDEPVDDEELPPARRLWLRFALLGVGTGAAGFLAARAGIALVERSLLSETVVGAILLAVITSLPELVTAVAAVRQGALTLAVGGIVGGNAFDVVQLGLADIAYRPGSIYHAISTQQSFLVALAILLTGVLLLGLLRRERSGPGGIGFESVLLLVLYLGGMVIIAQGG